MNKIRIPIFLTTIAQNQNYFYQKYMSKILSTFLIFSVNYIYSQLLTEKIELKKEIYQFKIYLNNPCENLSELSLSVKNKVGHFVRFESCQEDKTKLRGLVYGVVVIDDTLFNVSIETANLFFFNNESFLKEYKRFDKTKKLVLEETNLQLNLEHYNLVREEIRKEEEKKRRIEEEKKRLEEEEKKRLEEEEKRRIAKIIAQELANAIQKAQTDSLTNEELKINIGQLIEGNEYKNKLIESKVKMGLDNGGILITQFSFSTSDYGVVDLTLGILNVGKKRIKYATFKLQPLNSVDDLVEYEKSFKGIGFIEPNEEGVWNFESAWFSDVIQTLRLKNITLVYEDGGSKFISKIGEIRVDDDELLESIKTRQKKIWCQFGSVALIEYKDVLNEMVGFCIYSVSNKEFKAEVVVEDDAKIMIKGLTEIILNRKNNLIRKIGSFEVSKHSSMIYFYLEDGYCLISLNDAENILKKLNELFPNYPGF